MCSSGDVYFSHDLLFLPDTGRPYKLECLVTAEEQCTVESNARLNAVGHIVQYKLENTGIVTVSSDYVELCN